MKQNRMNSKIQIILEERVVTLQEYIKTSKDQLNGLKDCPKGRLRMTERDGGGEYYLVNAENAPTGMYIRKKDQTLIKQLAQRDYAEKIIKSSEEEIERIRYVQTLLQDAGPEKLYESMNRGRRALITPIVLPDGEFIREWLSVEYPHVVFNEDDPAYFTKQLQQVRSKSEILIADTLDRMGIPYRYECPLELDNRVTLHPDFTVLNVRTRQEMYWEHMGMMDDSEYCEKALSRILNYERNGLFPGTELILTHETNTHPLDTRMIERIAEKYLR